MTDFDPFQQVLKQLRLQFLSELPDRLNDIEALMLAQEREGLDPERFQDLFRKVHSLKGSGGTQGIHDITTVCHHLEDLLTLIQGVSGPAAGVGSALLGHLDLLRQVVDRARAGREPMSDLAERLAALKPQGKSALKVLLIDDNRLVSGLCLAVLKESEADVRLETDGYQGLLPALREPFDLIITAAETPVLNGMSLIASVKLSSRVNRHTPCILMTAHQTAGTTEGTPFGPDHVLMKDQTLPYALRTFIKDLPRIE